MMDTAGSNFSKFSMKELLKNAKSSLKSGHYNAFIDILNEIVKKRPQEWRKRLILEQIIPRPGSRGFEQVVARLTECVLVRREQIGKDQYYQLLNAVRTAELLHDQIGLIRARLVEQAIWANGNAETIYRLGVMLEDQSYLCEAELKKYMSSNPTASYLSDKAFQMQEIYENLVSAVVLINKYIIAERGGYQVYNTEPASPYNDPEIEVIILMAVLWTAISYQWEWVSYQDWLSTCKEETVLIHPYRAEEYRSYCISELRNESLKQEIALNLARYKDIITDNPPELEEIARTVIFEDGKSDWYSSIQDEVFINACKCTLQSATYEICLEKYHYEQIAENLVIGENENAIEWNDYYKCRVVLTVLCKVYQQAVRLKIKTTDTTITNGVIFTIRGDALTELLQRYSGLDRGIVKRFLTHMHNGSDERFLDIWDTPLIPLANDDLLVIPSLIVNGNILSSLENLVTKWNEDLFKHRGKSLENEITTFLNGVKGVTATGTFRLYSDTEEREIEYDVIARWGEIIFLIEAKCTKMVYGPKDMDRAKSLVESAAEQLRIRQEVLLREWRKIRSKIPKICPEIKSIDPGRIIKVILTNVMCFTGQEIDGCNIIDEYAFRRYFDKNGIELIDVKTGKAIKTVVMLQAKGIPIPGEFAEYIRKPPQIDYLLKRQKSLWKPLGPVWMNEQRTFSLAYTVDDVVSK